jgi:RNA polymerase sigma factor (sigma-70 family)
MNVQGAIERQVREHETRLQSFAFRLVGDREAARDIVQDVFLQALEAGKSDPAWLFVCARSRAIDHLRRRSLWRKFVDRLPLELSNPAGFEHQLAERDLGWTVLRRLPEKQRSLLLLRAYADLDYEQLAKIFDTTPQSIGVMLHRARKRAAQILEGDQ